MDSFLESRKGALALIVVASVFSFGVIVAADTSSTSVTVGNAAPSVSSVSFNGGDDLTLTENTSVTATTTVTVTDTNGCSDLSSVTAKFYLATTTDSVDNCTETNVERCYLSTCAVATSGNTCDGGSDTSAQYNCPFTVWYPAHPTDASAPTYSSAIWSVQVTGDDGTATSTATNTAETIEVGTLNSLNVTASIGYPSTAAGANTGTTNQTVTITNTGNTAIDADIGGDNMCTDYDTCSGDSFAYSQQKFGLSDVTYASLTNTLAASASPATIELDLAKPTSTSSAVTDLTYWGIAIPSGQAAGSYTGQNTFSPVAD